MPVMERAPAAAPLVPNATLVRDGDKEPAWMAAFRTQPLPSFSDLARDAKLPAVVPVAFARSAVAFGDTIDGALRTVDAGTENASALKGDPRVDQLRRMLARDASALRFSSGAEPKVVLEALPKAGDPRATAEAAVSPKGAEILKKNGEIAGRIGLPDPRELGTKDLLAYTRAAIEARARQLPQALRDKMGQMGEALDAVRATYAQNLGSDRGALAKTSDIAERAFLVSEGAKSPEQRKMEAAQGKVDPLFAASASAARAASREGYKESFMVRGLVSDVVGVAANDRLAKGEAPRRGEDWASTAQRLKRVGLIDATDPRAYVKEEPVKAKMAKTEAERTKDEGKAISDAFRDPSHAANVAKDAVKKQDDLAVEIKHRKPPEATADNSVTQIGWSGAYYTEEVSRDNRNATLANKMEADIRARHEKMANAVSKTTEDKANNQFARAGLVESAAVKAQGMGIGKAAGAVSSGFEQAAATANIGLTQVVVASKARAAVSAKKPQQIEGLER